MPRLVALLLAALVLALMPRSAAAGCPSSGSEGCHMADDVMAALDPHQDCVAFSIEENRCTCDALLVIDNDCAEALSAVGFSFRSCERGEVGCQDQGASSGETAVIAPGARATLDLPRPGADGLGEQSAELAVELGASEAVLTVRYEMVHLARDGAGCAAARSNHGASLALVLAAVILGLARASSPSMRSPRAPTGSRSQEPGTVKLLSAETSSVSTTSP